MLSEEDTLALLRCEMVRELQQVESLVVLSIPKGVPKREVKFRFSSLSFQAHFMLCDPGCDFQSLAAETP